MSEGSNLMSLFMLFYQQKYYQVSPLFACIIGELKWLQYHVKMLQFLGNCDKKVCSTIAVINYQSQSAKLRAASTTFSVYSGIWTLLDRGGSAASLIDCRYLEVTCFLGISSCKTGKFSLTYCDYDCFLTISFWFLDRHCMNPLEQLFVFQWRVYITRCSLLSSSESRSSASDQESDPPSYSSITFASPSSFLISWMILRNSSFSWLRSRRASSVSSVRMSRRDTSFRSLKDSVWQESLICSSLAVRVLPFLLLLLRNYFADNPLLFLMPVSTLALILSVGNRISNCAYLQNPCPTASPKSRRCFQVRGSPLLSLLSYSPLETQKVNAMGILIFQSM